MDLLAPARAFDRMQQRVRPLAVPFAVVKKFSDDQGGSLAALIAYYGFFSLFPLLLVLVTVMGFVLAGDPSLQKKVGDTVLGNFPGIGSSLQLGRIHGNTVALIIGIAGALWAGLGVTNEAEQAFDRVWAVPFKDRSNFAKKRLRGLFTLVVLGVLFVAASVASGLVGGGLSGPALSIAGVVISFALNLALFMTAFRLLTTKEAPTSALWPGTVVAALLWEVLQLVGGYYVHHVLKRAGGTYGTFAIVIALLTWLFLGARILVYAAEVNVVVHRRLWPRSLLAPPTTPEDERALAALAKVEERDRSEEIEVRFDGDPVNGHRQPSAADATRAPRSPDR